MSKRLLTTIAAGIVFITMLYTTEYTPIELATGITMILAVYVGGETLKPSNHD